MIPNRFGRKPGRGIRPWLLLPKVIAIGVYLGGLAAAAVLWFTARVGQFDFADPRRGAAIESVSGVVRLLVVPALLAALALGLLLFCQHPRQFLRMRWLIVKIVFLAIIVPFAHFFLSSRMAMIRRSSDASAARQFGSGLLVVIAASIWIIILGRLKPRLGQNWARAYARSGPADRLLPPDAK